MKKFILILIVSIGISFNLSAQSAGDYRSAASGDWNDPTKWETYNGSSWVNASSYPGQNPGSGAVTIMVETMMKITATVPHAVASLYITGDYFCDFCPDGETMTPSFGTLTFSAETAVSLAILGGVGIFGELRVENKSGAKTHSISIGGSLFVGDSWYDYYYYQTPTVFETINQDDKLSFTFNTTVPDSYIVSYLFSIQFQDITFNGIGISVFYSIEVSGTATFINGIVTIESGGFGFHDGATVSGASSASFVNGPVSKTGNDPFTFPIGRGQVYSPMTISAPEGAFETLLAYYNINPAGPGVQTISDPGLYSISNCEYWVLNRTSGNNINYSLDITVGWASSANECGPSPYIGNVSNVTLAKSSSGVWNSHGGSGIGTTTNGSVTWYGVNNLEEYSYFTLGNLSSSCITPLGLNVTNINASSAQLSWTAVSGSLSYDVDYKLSSTFNDWTNAVTATTSTSINLVGLNSLMTYDWRVRARCSSSSSAYRVSQLTTPPATCSSPSGLTTTNISSNSAMLSWNAVTGAVNYNVQYKTSGSGMWITAVASTVSLSYSLSGLSALTAYDWRVGANCGNYTVSSFNTSPPLCNDVYEPNNTSSQARTISLGVVISAGISSTTDVDWFKVTIPGNSNSILSVYLVNQFSDDDLYVYNKNLGLVGSSTTTMGNEIVSVNARGKNLTFYIKVIGKNGAYNATHCYNLQAEVSGGPKPAVNASAPVNEVTTEKSEAFLYPNPASDFVYLNFNSATGGLVNIQIINSIGQLVKQHPVNTNKGHNQFKIQVPDIRPGMYILRINKGDLNLTRKFVIAR